jgi:GNAT superfamily N-acetyltransferase
VIALRAATRGDIADIERVMRDSLREIGRTAYNEMQVASSLVYLAVPDEQLIDDGTYYVAVAEKTIVGCGGWSRRRKTHAGSTQSESDNVPLDPRHEPARIRAMFVDPRWARQGIGRQILELCERGAAAAGFHRLQLVAMRSGEAMYRACGYVAVADAPVRLEDGVILECTLMEKASWPRNFET